jgi:hypothetical protein
MKIKLEINGSKKAIKQAIASGWKDRTGKTLALKDVEYPGDEEDILCAIPHLDRDMISVTEVSD